ncbi:PAS domain S-box protein [Chitinibacter sp. FCG-7]|uniref:PAS domain S-box protein n=1 Tax=Chitinibacter mangrovi TaxID=3153927 RepID=A0AAU7FBT0_9NEIS
MQVAAPPDNETERLHTLHNLCVLDTEPEEELDRITRLAARHFDVPICLISLVDQDRQWFKSNVGLNSTQSSRKESFCAHAILHWGALIVPDAHEDERFADNPAVTGYPFVRFYAGYPIRSRQGHALGTLCLIDTRTRTFSDDEKADLHDFAVMVQTYFQTRENDQHINQVERHLASAEEIFQKVFAQAAVGIALVSPEGQWLKVNQSLCKLVGYDQQEMQSLTFQQITYPDDLHTDLQYLNQLVRGDIATYTLEKRYIRSNGQIVWVELTVSLMRDAQGQPLHFISVLSDIDARKQAEFALADLRHNLEQRVEIRTAEMAVAISQLNHQMEKRIEIQQELQAEKERFQITLENAVDAFLEIDQNGQIIAWNLAAEQMFGWLRKEALGRKAGDMIIPARRRRPYWAELKRYLKHGQSGTLGRRLQIVACRKDGEEFIAELTLSENRIGEQRLVDAFVQDVSVREAAKKEILEHRRLLKAVTDHLPALIAYVDTSLRYLFINQVFQDWFGISAEALLAMRVTDLLEESTHLQISPYMDRVLAGEQVAFDSELNTLQGCQQVHVDFIPHIDELGKVTGFYIQVQDITQRKQLENQLAFEASHDQLTGLPNRRAFMLALDAAIARAKRHQQPMALLFLDLDGFKQLNDAHGHEFGDKVLQYFAATISAASRETDTVARLAGDEFTMILENLGDNDSGAIQVAQRILEQLAVPCLIDGHSVQLSSSIGIALTHSGDELASELLLAKADAAMYQAKAAGKGRFALN